MTKKTKEVQTSPELGAALTALLDTNTDALTPPVDERIVAVDTEAFVKLDKTSEPKPKVKMFEVPVGGEVIMPTGEILKISVFFPPELPPARVGVYVTKQEDSVIDAEADAEAVTVGFSHYNGEHWGPQFQTPDSASANHGAAKWPNKPWAALVEEHPDNQI